MSVPLGLAFCWTACLFLLCSSCSRLTDNIPLSGTGVAKISSQVVPRLLFFLKVSFDGPRFILI